MLKRLKDIFEKIKKFEPIAFNIAFALALFSLFSSLSPFITALTQTATLDTLVFKNEQGKTVVLQGMAHIAPKDFFNYVNSNIKNFLNESPNGKIFTEGVNIDKETDLADINNTVSTLASLNEDLDLTNYYRSMATFLGMQYENDSNYLDNVNKDILVNADLSAKDFLKIYGEQKSIKNEEDLDNENALSKKDLDDMVKNKDNPTFYFKKFSKKLSLKIGLLQTQENKCLGGDDLWTTVLLDERNRNLINMIEKEPSDIFVTYGSAHLYCGNAPLVNTLKERGYTLVRVSKFKYEM